MELIGKMSRPSATTRKYTCKTKLACPYHNANKYAPLYISNSSYGRKLCLAFRLQVLLLSFLYNVPTVGGSTTFPQTIRNYFGDNRLKFEPRWPISLIFKLLWMVLFYCWRIFLESSGLCGITREVLNVTEYNGAAFLVLDCYDSMRCSFVVLSVLMHLTLTYISYALFPLRLNEK